MCAREGTWGANVRPAAVREGRARAEERVREGGRAGAASGSSVKPGKVGRPVCKVERWEQAGDPVSLQPGLQPSGQEVARGRPALPRSSVCLPIYNNLPALGLLFWVPGSYEASKVQKKKKIQPPRNPQIQEFQPLYPQDLGTLHGPTAPGMVGTPCLFSERFCPRAPFLTPLRPPVRFLRLHKRAKPAPRC